MSDAATATTRPEAARPPAISLRELWPWCLFGSVVLLTLLAVVGLAGSSFAVGPGDYIHEFLHDGRHILTVPCH